MSNSTNINFAILSTVLILLICLLRLSVAYNYDEGNELLESAKNTHCGSKATLDKKCMADIIKGYYQLFDFCNDICADNCLNCTDDKLYNNLLKNYTDNDIKNKIPEIGWKSVYCMVELKFNCKDTKSIEEVVKNPSTKKDALSYTKYIYSKMVNKMKWKFTKCIPFKTLITESDTTNKAEDFIKDITAFLMLHQLQGFALSDDCNSQPPKVLVINELYKIMGLSNFGELIKEKGLKLLLDKLNIGKEITSNKTDEHDHDHDHVLNKRSINDHLTRLKRSTNNDSNCISVDNLYNVMGYDHENGLTYQQFQTLSPILLQQVASNACSIQRKPSTSKSVTVAEKYGYGTLSVFLICVCSVIGVLIIPFGNKKFYNSLVTFLIGLGIGSLISDSVLHLIPQVIGVHAHEPKVIGMLLGVSLSTLCMLIVESIFIIRENKKTRVDKYELNSVKKEGTAENTEGCTDTDVETKAPKSVALMVILGDGIHNFADGLAIGAAFSVSTTQGLAISIAVFCHELPHEFGDFAILLSTGMSWKKALIANFVSSLTAFIGLYVGISVSTFQLASQIILAIAAGIFLYIAIGDMIPHYKTYIKRYGITYLVIGVLGILLGYFVITVLAFYEEDIKI